MRQTTVSLLPVLIIAMCSCTSGPAEWAVTDEEGQGVSVNVENGATDVDVNKAFTMTFTAPASVPTVNNATFFIVPSSAQASLSKGSIQKAAIDTTICDSSNAVSAAITQSSSGSCDTTYTLTPDLALNPGTEYALCATSAIAFCNPDGHLGSGYNI